MRLKLAALAMAAVAAPADAEWLKAGTRHFTIYSDTSAQGIGELATRLERLDAAMRKLLALPDTAEAAANPVTVYVVDDVGDIRRLIGAPGIAGFYLGRASGAVAFTPRAGAGGRDGVQPQIVLFHEYAHHFLLSNFALALPAWFSEGYAEFVATATADDKEVTLGRAAQHRAQGLFADRPLPIRTLFAPGRLTPQERDQIYGRGWLLTHYLFTSAERYAIFRTYLAKLNSGMAPLQAASEAFGDLAELDRALNRYLRARGLQGYVYLTAKLPAVSVDVRPLTPGERALIEMRMLSTRGVGAKTAGPLHARAAKAAAAFPNDPVAQGWLAEMAFDAGDLDGAEAAADRALAADPQSVQALLYKGRARLRRAADAKSSDPKVWREARSWIVKANRLNPDGAAALALYYDSFAVEGAKPSASAVAGLHRAVELAPQDQGLRFRSVTQHLSDGNVAEAKRALRPLAFDPHAGPGNPAARLMALLDAGATGPAALAAMAEGAKAAAGKGDAAGGD